MGPHHWRIDQVDMHYRDQRALEIIQSKVDRETKRAKLSATELACMLGCHYNTVGAIIARLVGAGYIKRYGDKKSPFLDIEVLCPPSTTTSNI
jgi:DNA-binding MarR family transcriptional regulator